MQYNCKRCGYQSDRKGDMKKHLSRQNPCPAMLQDIPCSTLLEELCQKRERRCYCCEICQTEFSSSQSKYLHKQRCEKNYNELVSKSEINELRTQLEELRSQMNNRPNLIQQNNHGTVNNIQNNITINALGKENVSYITDNPNFKQFMIRCIKQRADGVCEFLMRKHFDPKHPENNNIKKLNKKDNFMEVFDGADWKVRFSEDVLDDVFIHLQKDFAQFVEQELCSDDGKLKIVSVENFMKYVGAPLEWDLSTFEHDFTSDCLSEERKADLKKKLYMLALEHIYRKSKEVYVSGE